MEDDSGASDLAGDEDEDVGVVALGADWLAHDYSC